ncbi:triple tyrosine motif-containing protein [Chitinophaga sp. 30R24]|uniref:triple tyrosine motif-containing protein n=1 Tax=Chitinophaga sp. 30R24 TaxID=3248838 RepID=UPI003B90E4D4
MSCSKYLFFLITLLPWSSLHSQNTIGLPAIINYDKTKYQGNGQTWDIDTDQNGILYFANNEGLITFNGNTWNLLPVPNNTRLRSVKIDADQRIYIGAQDEFGYYQANQRGILQYTSLKNIIPDRQQFADIWNIVFYQHHVFFRSNNKIFDYDHQQVKVFNAPVEWKILGATSGGLFAQDRREGLLKLENGQWQPICTNLGNKLITAIIESRQDTLLVATLKDGLFHIVRGQLLPLHTEADTAFRSNRIYCAVRINPSQLAVGTFSRGCYIVNGYTGAIVQQFTRDEGLQNNNVLRIFSDRRQHIWLALDNGIDQLQYNAAIRHITPDHRNLLGSYAALVHQRTLYIGTSDGLYASGLDSVSDISLSKGYFQPVANTKGQVWHLSVAYGRLLMGHHEGTFEISHGKAIPLLKDIGCWSYLPMTKSMLTGCYNGLAYMNLESSPVAIKSHIPGLYESLRFLAPDNAHQVWTSHPYRGIYHITLLPDTSLQFKLFTAKDGLPSDYNNYVFYIQGQMLAATQQGIYEFDRIRQRFSPSPKYASLFQQTAIQYMKEDQHGNIWFISDKKTGVADIKRHTITYFPELTGRIISGFEFIYPYDSQNIFIGGDKGIFHLNYTKYTQSTSRPTVLLGKVLAGGKKDSILAGGYSSSTPAHPIQLPYYYSNYHFEYASPGADQSDNVTYSYQLVGNDAQPSEWSSKTEKEYTNLLPGHYTFKVYARDNLGHTSAAAAFQFIIWPAWYQTTFARIVYLLLLVVFLYYIYCRQQQRLATQQLQHRKEQEQLIIRHQLELERNEMQLVKLRNEKLQDDVLHKNKELATAAMNIVQKGKILSHIKETLLESINKTSEPAQMPNFKKVLRLFEEAENNEEDWEHFSRHFDEVHNNFLLSLKKQFPKLSTTDLKLCAYLRINLTTKEIAQSMGISARGVETSRYRLRKKLDIPAEKNLYDFLLQATATPGK